jgi:DNA polymerase III gamma/tau subunit
MDGIMIAEALISYARIAQLSKVDTSSLLAEMMENAHFDISMDDLDNLMDTVNHQTSENPLPAMKEDNQEEVNDENITS